VAPAGDLHASWPSVDADPMVRAVARCRPTGPAVVLGSTQRTVEPADTAGVPVTRRRSGGGAVLVGTDDPVWVDLWVPAGDPLWVADVTRAFAWLGRAWADTLVALGLSGVEVQGDGPGACTRWSTLVCFGGVGAGEVTVDGRKAVGLAQRRDRRGAWFHSACVVHWDPSLLLGALVPDADERAAATEGLTGAVTGVADAARAQGSARVPGPDEIASTFLHQLT